jgi:zinc and cadmium transporter
MSDFAYVIIFSFLGSVASLAGGFLLLAKKNVAQNLSHLLSSFAAGALLGAAFFDLLPEAIEESDAHILTWVVIGFMVFFLTERFIHWFHHHHEHNKGETLISKPIVPLIVIGDTVHNLIDGLVIGGAFLVDVRLGIVTAIATAAHEIPQEIGDFGVLLAQGVSKKKVVLLNIASAVVTVLAAAAAYMAGEQFGHGVLPYFLAVTAGFFIYIAASDLIPEIHQRDKRSFALMETVLLILGADVVWIAIQLLEHGH